MAIVQEDCIGGSDDNPVRHPIFWFDDGSVVVRVQDHLYKIHKSLLSRHSNFFAHYSVTKLSDDVSRVPPADCDYIVVDLDRRVLAGDVEVLLEHLYHDVSLFSDASLSRIISALRVSSPLQLDFPTFHTFARQKLLSMYNGSVPFPLPGDLGDALALATEYRITPMQKAVYYMLVTSPDHNFELDKDSMTEQSGTLANPVHLGNDAHRRTLSQTDAKRCTQLMTRMIDHFTPILFTPPATPHIPCTDVFAETWMSLVIQPGLDNDGVYKPLETLQLMKDTDWDKEGLCQSCVLEKHDEWTEEQKNVWTSLDAWLELDREE